MLLPSGVQRYKAVQITTSSPGDVLLMLYDGLFRFLAESIVALRADDRARAGEKLDRAHCILSELAASLDAKHAPALCEQLEALYLFCAGRLVEANLHQDPARVEDVMRVLSPVRDAFRTVIRPNTPLAANGLAGKKRPAGCSVTLRDCAPR
jgi:flagellar protein FliS